MHDRASLERSLRTGNFGSHADFIAAIVDGIALTSPTRIAFITLRPAQSSRRVYRPASVSAPQTGREEAEAERREEPRERCDDRIPFFMGLLEPAAMATSSSRDFWLEPAHSLRVRRSLGGAITGEPVRSGPTARHHRSCRGSRPSILRLNHPQATYYVSENP